mmetsp:Transcript_19517/g.36538  ORF Transcript_19517/g.36538 Transcript_19517/m.36538 type:complete len:233 (+) Transcript_19517:1198-1896(+)
MKHMMPAVATEIVALVLPEIVSIQQCTWQDPIEQSSRYELLLATREVAGMVPVTPDCDACAVHRHDWSFLVHGRQPLVAWANLLRLHIAQRMAHIRRVVQGSVPSSAVRDQLVRMHSWKASHHNTLNKLPDPDLRVEALSEQQNCLRVCSQRIFMQVKSERWYWRHPRDHVEVLQANGLEDGHHPLLRASQLPWAVFAVDRLVAWRVALIWRFPPLQLMLASHEPHPLPVLS